MAACVFAPAVRESPTMRKLDASVRFEGSGVSLSEPASTSGDPFVGRADSRPKRKRRRMVVACSGSSAAMRSTNARAARRRPSRLRSDERNSAF